VAISLPRRTAGVNVKEASDLHQHRNDRQRQLDEELKEALNHLHSPDYEPPQALCALIGCDVRQGALGVQSGIMQMIRDLKPADGTPPTAHARRMYELLHYRYALQLTQEETAEHLCVSRSTVQRMQQEAIHELARLLWEARETRPSMPSRDQEGGTASRGEEEHPGQAPDWRSQAERELAALEAQAPDAMSDVREVIGDVLRLQDTIPSREGVELEARLSQASLTAPCHPSVLRQTLITALKQLIGDTPPRRIMIFGNLEDGDIKITLVASFSSTNNLSEGEVVEGILAPEGVSVELDLDGRDAFLSIVLPSVNKVNVLVIEDNRDMIDFYRRCTRGTAYRIIHATGSAELFKAIRTTKPHIIVLDVVLPDVDGWDVLMRLHNNPRTGSIPIVVCTVVREEELALSLGARRYLSKPVQPEAFTRALDQCLDQIPSAARRDVESNAAAC
jgi:CheY-like chemotaxis protein